MWVLEKQKLGQNLHLSHWSRGIAWHSAKIAKNHGQNAVYYP